MLALAVGRLPVSHLVCPCACAAAAALSWGDAGEEALTEVYNGGEDAEEDEDGAGPPGKAARLKCMCTRFSDVCIIVKCLHCG